PTRARIASRNVVANNTSAFCPSPWIAPDASQAATTESVIGYTRPSTSTGSPDWTANPSTTRASLIFTRYGLPDGSSTQNACSPTRPATRGPLRFTVWPTYCATFASNSSAVTDAPAVSIVSSVVVSTISTVLGSLVTARHTMNAATTTMAANIHSFVYRLPGALRPASVFAIAVTRRLR